MPACLVERIHSHRIRLGLGVAHAGLGHRPPLQGRAESEPDRSLAATAAASAAVAPLACTTCLLSLWDLLLVSLARSASSAAPSASRRLGPLLALVLHLGVLRNLGHQPAGSQIDPHSWGLRCEHLICPNMVSSSRPVFFCGHPPQLDLDPVIGHQKLIQLCRR